jgi:hypothetical protein
MTPVTGNFDEMLRRALHAEADSIEPAEDGLERIRQRTHAPWLLRQASLMLTECVDLARLIGIRLEPGLTGARAAVGDRGGAREAFVDLLSSIVSVLVSWVTPSRRRSAAHRGGPGGTPHARARVGSNLAWLRPALAVAGAVVIVAAGVFGLAQVRDNLVLELFPGSNPASTGGGGGSNSPQAPTLQGQSAPGAVLPTSSGAGSASPSPKATCSRAAKRQATPTPTSTTTQTPTPTPTPSADPPPTDTPTPTPTDSTAATTLSVSAVSFQTVQNAAPAATCTQATPARGASG